MKEYFGILKRVRLFQGIEEGELYSLLRCLDASVKNVGRGEILLLAGDRPSHVGVLLSGRLHILKEDYDGGRALAAAITPGELFAEALCCAGVGKSPVTVAADTEGAVMLVPFSRILSVCPSACEFHTRIIKNMLAIIAGKNLMLQSRMELIGLKSVRAKVMHYLESFSPERGHSVDIPLNRGEMADFLCVDRSALSHELAKMRADGLIEYRKNHFTLL